VEIFCQRASRAFFFHPPPPIGSDVSSLDPPNPILFSHSGAFECSPRRLSFLLSKSDIPIIGMQVAFSFFVESNIPPPEPHSFVLLLVPLDFRMCFLFLFQIPPHPAFFRSGRPCLFRNTFSFKTSFLVYGPFLYRLPPELVVSVW